MSLATSYAKALYLAAKETGTSNDAMDQLETQLGLFVHALEDKQVRGAVLGPVMAAKDKIALIEAIAQKAGFARVFTNFLILLANKGRLTEIDKINGAFSEVRLEAEGGVSGKLVSAEPIGENDVQGLAKAFGKKLGKKVAFRVTTDPALLAGMKVTVNGVTYDGTLRSQLTQLRERLVTQGSL